jgi:hypothetical protein
VPIDLGDSVRLNEVLPLEGHAIKFTNNGQVGIQNRVPVLECGRELELIADGRLARGEVTPGGDVDFVKHIVVEVVYVGPDPRFLVGIDGERDDERFLAFLHVHEGVNVGRVG